MTIVRALLRRGMAKRPSSVKLANEFELEWLATELANHKGNFGSHFSKPQERHTEDHSWRAFRVVTGGEPADGERDTSGTAPAVRAEGAPGILGKPGPGPHQQVSILRCFCDGFAG